MNISNLPTFPNAPIKLDKGNLKDGKQIVSIEFSILTWNTPDEFSKWVTREQAMTAFLSNFNPLIWDEMQLRQTAGTLHDIPFGYIGLDNEAKEFEDVNRFCKEINIERYHLIIEQRRLKFPNNTNELSPPFLLTLYIIIAALPNEPTIMVELAGKELDMHIILPE